MKNFKRVLSLALAALMVIGGLVVAPVDAKAADTYTKITSVDQITDGGYYVIVAPVVGDDGTEYFAMRNDVSNNVVGSVPVAISGDSITPAGTYVPVWKLAKDGDSYTFYNGEKYLSYNTEKKVALTDTNTDAKQKWNISIAEGVVTIEPSSTDAQGLAYNASSPRFTPYKKSTTTVNHALEIYKYNGTTVTYPEDIAYTGTDYSEAISKAYLAMHNGVKYTNSNTYTITGTVVKDTALSKNDDGTIKSTEKSLNIKVGDQEIQCYNLKWGDVTTSVSAGDIVEVEATIGYYIATVQANGGVLKSHTVPQNAPIDLDVPEGATQKEIVELAYTLGAGRKLTSETRLTVTITELTDITTYGDKNGYGTVEGATDKPIYFYGLKGDVKNLKVGDKVDVIGTLQNYEDKIQMSMPLFVAVGEPKPANIEVPAKATDAEIAKLAYDLHVTMSFTDSVTITGVVDKISTPYKDGATKISVIIKVPGAEDYPILCYNLSGDKIADVKVGDTIKVSGVIKNYNGTIEFGGCTLDAHTAAVDPIKPMGDINAIALYIVLFAGVSLVVASILGKKRIA